MRKCIAEPQQHHTWFVNSCENLETHIPSYIFFLFAQHFAIITLSQKNTDKTNSLVSDGHDSSDCCQLMETIILFFLQEKDVFISCHGHNLFHIDQNFLPSFFSNHGNLTKKRTYSNSGKFQTSKCGILLPLVYYWNLFPVFFFCFQTKNNQLPMNVK